MKEEGHDFFYIADIRSYIFISNLEVIDKILLNNIYEHFMPLFL